MTGVRWSADESQAYMFGYYEGLWVDYYLIIFDKPYSSTGDASVYHFLPDKASSTPLWNDGSFFALQNTAYSTVNNFLLVRPDAMAVFVIQKNIRYLYQTEDFSMTNLHAVVNNDINAAFLISLNLEEDTFYISKYSTETLPAATSNHQPEWRISYDVYSDLEATPGGRIGVHVENDEVNNQLVETAFIATS